jgi:hypothetical protein
MKFKINIVFFGVAIALVLASGVAAYLGEQVLAARSFMGGLIISVLGGVSGPHNEAPAPPPPVSKSQSVSLRLSDSQEPARKKSA